MDAKEYAARNRQGNDWFIHHSDAPVQNDKPAVVDVPQGGTTKAQMIKPVCDSNQWFKHAEGDDPSKKSNGEGKPGKVEAASSACATWCIGGGESKAPEVEHRSRVVTKEGEAYCVRDKTSSNWFSHEPGNSDKSQGASGHRVGSAEGNQNATRMRGQSENWFSHDPNAPPEPLHSTKGKLGGKGPSSDMYNVFHHDQ